MVEEKWRGFPYILGWRISLIPQALDMVFLFVDLFTYTIVGCPYVIHNMH